MANETLGGGNRFSCLVGGTRSGKTFQIIRAIMIRAIAGDKSRHAILRFRANAARASVSLDTLPTVAAKCFPGVRLTEHRQDGFFSLPNGSELHVGGLDDKDRVEKILGLEYATIFLNEASQIPYGSALIAFTRLAQVVPGLKQRAYVDLNPVGKAHWTNKLFGEHKDPISGQTLADPENYRRAFLNPVDNAHNLAPEFLRSLQGMPEKQRKRFYEGVYVDEVDGALWTYELLARSRAEPEDIGVEKREKIVVAVDPSGASGKDDNADEIGIVVIAKGGDGIAYVLEDCSLLAGPGGPGGWAAAAVSAYKRHNADRIVAERNFGGEMVRTVIQAVDCRVPVKLVTASRGKHIRAEPIATLYEQGKVRHVGRFAKLEEQLCAFTSGRYTGIDSPDNADALIHGVTDLMLTEQVMVPVASIGTYSSRLW